MPCRRIQPGKTPGGTGMVPLKEYAYPNGQTFKKGAVMILSANIAQEGAANPVANILGIAQADVDTNLGYGAANNPTQVTGRKQTVMIARASRQTIFTGALTNNSDVLVAPALTDVGTSIGLRKRGADGIWTVDKTATAAVKIQDYETNASDQFVYFQFNEAVLAFPS